MNWLVVNLERHNITQYDLSMMSGISQSRLSRLCQLVSDEDLFSKMYAKEKFVLRDIFSELDKI